MKHILILFLSFFYLSTHAQTSISFQDIITTGTGCPQGTVSTILSPDGRSLSLLFDQYRVEVPNYETTNNQTPPPRRGPNYRPPGNQSSVFESHKTCNITFTTALPAGLMATAININVQVRGNTMTASGIQSYFTTILVGHRGLSNSIGPQVRVVEKKMWNGRTDASEDWITNTNVSVPLKSNCSNGTNKLIRFELKNHLEAKILDNDERRAGIVTVDSSDTKGSLTFSLSTTPCR